MHRRSGAGSLRGLGWPGPRSCDQIFGDLGDVAAAAQRHRQVELDAQQLERVAHAGLAVDREAPQDGPADLHRLGPASSA